MRGAPAWRRRRSRQVCQRHAPLEHPSSVSALLHEPALMAASVDVPDQARARHCQHQLSEAAIVGRVVRGGGTAAGRDDLDGRALPHPAALAVLVVGAIGERELEAAVFLQEQFGTDFHDAVKVVVAGKTGIARLAGVGRAGRANSQRAGKGACKLQTYDDTRSLGGGQRLPAPLRNNPAMMAATAAKAG